MALAPAGNKPPLLLLLILFSVFCDGNQHQQFINSCGDIHNISFPFQLQGDPSNTCNDNFYTLSCDENNRTVLHLLSGKYYYVQSIDYTDQSIRLVDIGIQTNNICSSFPLSSFNLSDFGPVVLFTYSYRSSVLFLSCEKPVQSPTYINRTRYCNTRDDSGNGYNSYVVAAGDDFRVWDIADSCLLKVSYISTSRLIRERGWNLSWLDFNKELGYGFVASFGYYGGYYRGCNRCKERAYCFGDSVNVTAVCRDACSHVYRSSLWTGNLWTDIVYAGLYLVYFIVPPVPPFWYGPSGPWFVLHVITSTVFAVFAARLLCVPCVVWFLVLKFRRRHLSTFDSIEGFLRSQNNLAPIRYSYSDIKRMTNGFRDKLGEGGYGTVYKGKLRSGPPVAVKMLSKPKANGQEFINEVATIGRIHHVNVVQLIGYCAERSKRALVYDFMPNGSLEKYISSPDAKLSLSCKQMYEISLGVARGVGYLHQGCDIQILHFDIKPHNILLDENFTPKVSDFGLAKLYPTDESTITMTAARGTLGYMAPELFYKNIGGISYKADIYSFGMLLMELAGRRRNWNSSANSSQVFFPSWVYDQFVEGKNLQIGETTEEESEMVKKMMLVALWCIQMRPSDRPSMNKVVEMLEGNLELLHTPSKPFLYSQAMPAANNGMNIMLPNLSGACSDAMTSEITGR
ncbi:rust resistance kinase Lr10-like [Rhododendron vialii]|uniref:rust resistance kinase Lr10-like n=1 Tax=Rhododendron vialii TaxID=182163 RepID=UPI00265DBE43|nr:rust resistance kinase Lr10-like [Rhododendron vialii]